MMVLVSLVIVVKSAHLNKKQESFQVTQDPRPECRVQDPQPECRDQDPEPKRQALARHRSQQEFCPRSRPRQHLHQYLLEALFANSKRTAINDNQHQHRNHVRSNTHCNQCGHLSTQALPVIIQSSSACLRLLLGLFQCGASNDHCCQTSLPWLAVLPRLGQSQSRTTRPILPAGPGQLG